MFDECVGPLDWPIICCSHLGFKPLLNSLSCTKGATFDVFHMFGSMIALEPTEPFFWVQERVSGTIQKYERKYQDFSRLNFADVSQHSVRPNIGTISRG